MPTLSINGHDVDVDDGFLKLSPEQQNATVDEIARSLPASSDAGGLKQDAPSLLEGLGRAVATGVPVLGGLANRADAATDAALSYGLNGLFSPDQQLHGSFGDRYTQALAAQQGADQAFHQAHPIADTAAQIGGGVASGVGAGRAGLTLAGRFGTGAMTGMSGLAARMGLMGAEGAALGGADAATRGNNIGTGVALGGLGGAGGDALGEAAQVARNVFSPATNRAEQIVRRLADSDALTPESAAGRLSDLGPAGVIADLGPNLQQGARAVASAPGNAQKRIVQALMERQDSSGQRVTDALDTVLGPRTNVMDSADQIAASRAAAARPLYDTAYASEVPMTDELGELLQRPAMQSAMNKAAKLASDAGETFDPAKPTVMGLDYTKRALDDAISSAQRAGNNNEARILIGNKNALLAHMDRAVPEYAQARRVFSDYSGVAQALQDGQKVFSNSMTPEQLSRTLDGMPYAEKQAYLEGARQQITQTMGTARNDSNAAKAIFDRGYNREKMAKLIGGNASGWLNNAVDAERTFAATNNAARSGSMTDRNMLAQQIIPGDQKTPVLRSLLNMRFGDALLGVGERMAGGVINARNENTRDEVARLLLSRELPNMPAQSNAVRNNIANALLGISHEGDR